MDKITVGELAAECSVQNSIILSELKRLGLYVFSPSAIIDASFAETIRKKILSQREAAEAKKAEEEKKKGKEIEAVRKAEKKVVKEPEVEKKAPGRRAQVKPQESAPVKEAPVARKAKKAAPVVEFTKEIEEPAKPSMAPRKGRKHYDREAATLVEGAVPPELPPMVEAAREHLFEAEPAPVEGAALPAEIEPEIIEGKPPVEATPGAVPEVSPGMAARAGAPGEPVPVEQAAAPVAEPVHTPGMVSKKVVVRKTKSQILKRTSPEKVIAPEVSDRILRGLRDARPTVTRIVTPARPLKRKSTDRVEAPAAKVVEFPRPPISPEEFKPLAITEGVTLKELAEKMDIKSKYIIQKLISKGILASINQTLDLDVAKEVCAEFGFKAAVISFEQEAEIKQEVEDRPEDHVARSPVVTIMGHVDHGKTSLLDAVRETNVTATEAGGITQHIGAYRVNTKGRGITFLDTPGHEAFTLMRARGAQATDIVVLVVAADDGVMPQTIEAIHHAKAANVPIIVAINKVDKPGAQPERVKQALSDQGLVAEDWGGDVVMVQVSAKMKTNLDLLLEMILLVADLKDLKANPKRLAQGVVLEAKVDRGRGCVATVLVQNGILRVGDSFVAGAVHGRVRALINDRGMHSNEAGPSVPVEIQGLQDLPQAGDTFQVFEDAAKARHVAEYRQAKLREQSLRSSARLSLQALFQQMREGKIKELQLILKADVQGSVEVLTDMLNKLSTDKAKVHILHGGAGAIT
jgi:translation initiation factor IF-2